MLNDFLYFTRTERIGILVLAILALLLLVMPAWLPDRSEYDSSDFSVLAAKIDQRDQSLSVEKNNLPVDQQEAVRREKPKPFQPSQATVGTLEAVGLSSNSIRAWMSYLRKGGQFRSWESIENFRSLTDEERNNLRPFLIFPSQEKRETTDQPKEVAELDLQPFDPNRVEEAQLLAMGVPQKAASNWLKFLSSGGHFKQPTDIQKVYGLPASTAEALIPHIQMAATTPLPSVVAADPSDYEEANTDVIIDINQATVEQWQQLRGIGPAYSKRIVNFREKLGGFLSVEQVAETYGIPDSVFQSIYLQLRPSAILRPLSINQLGVEEMAIHPYLSKTNARNIVRYREEHGPYQSAADLGKLYGLSEEVKKNITPYLDFN